MKKLTKILPLLLLVIPLGGCFVTDKIQELFTEKVAEQIINEGTDTDVDLDLDDDGGVTITTDEGETSVGSKAEIPDNWPNDVPIIDHDEIISASTYKDSNSGTVSYQIMVQSSESYADTKNYYTTEMASEDWEELSVIDSAGTTMYSFEKGEDSCGVWVIEEEEETVVTITVTR